MEIRPLYREAARAFLRAPAGLSASKSGSVSITSPHFRHILLRLAVFPYENSATLPPWAIASPSK